MDHLHVDVDVYARVSEEFDQQKLLKKITKEEGLVLKK